MTGTLAEPSATASDTSETLPTELPSVTLVIVTYNSAAVIATALRSVAAQTFPAARIRTVVVDSDSRDDTLRIVREDFPWAEIVWEGVNYGYTRGNNTGMRRFPADYYALINPDVELDPHWVSATVTALEADLTIGVAGSKTFFGNKVLLQHVGGFFRANKITYHPGVNELDIGQYDTPTEGDYMQGAAILARGAMAEQVGYLPEAYFMYYEEVEFCVRARAAGYRVVYLPQAVAYHYEKHSVSGTGGRRFLWLYQRSRFLFVLRNVTTPQARREFIAAERAWKREHVRGGRFRLLLLGAKLAHWRLLLRDPWLLLA
ncbi:MAG TPA: glycosyltransferase family 2 protein [Ktedonobacterales bacterium]